MSNVLDLLVSENFLEFYNLYKRADGKLGLIVTFLAVLELVKDSMIQLVQSDSFGPIHVKAKDKVHWDYGQLISNHWGLTFFFFKTFERKRNIVCFWLKKPSDIKRNKGSFEIHWRKILRKFNWISKSCEWLSSQNKTRVFFLGGKIMGS